MNKKKLISLFTMIIMILNMFSPYMQLIVNAATGTLESDCLVFHNMGVNKLANGNKVLRLQIGYSSNETLCSTDLSFKINTSQLMPCLKTTGIVNTAENMANMVASQNDYYGGSVYSKTYKDNGDGTATINIVSSTAGGFNAAANGYVGAWTGDPNFDTAAAEFNTRGYYPIIDIYFKIMDSSIDTNALPSSLFTLAPQGASSPTGCRTVYINSLGIEDKLDIPAVNYGGGFVGAPTGPVVTGITVKTPPTNTTYDHGDTINLAGGVITATYSDGTTKDINMKPVGAEPDPGITILSPVGGVANINAGTVLIQYEGQTASFPVTVNDPIVSINPVGALATTTYNQDNPIVFTGLSLEAVKKSGGTISIPITDTNVTPSETTASVNSPNFTKTGTNGVLDTGTQNITFTYTNNGQNYTTTTPVSIIVNDTVTGVSVIDQPTKQAYKRGENLVLTGAKVRLTLGSGNTPIDINLPNSGVTVGAFSNTTVGSVQHLSVAYGGVPSTDTIDVEAYNYITNVTLTSPTNVNPVYDTNLNLAGGQFNLTWQDGSVTHVNLTDTTKVSVTGYNEKTTTPQTITAVLSDNYVLSDGTKIPYSYTKTFSVVVIDTVTSITVTKPTKTTYKHGEALDLTGGTITINYASGNTTPITMTQSMIKESDGSAVNMSPVAYDSTNKVSKTLKISYTDSGKTGSVDYPIEIINDVKSIAVNSTNHKVKYKVTDSLDITNLEILVTRAVGTPETKSITNINDVSGFNSSTPDIGQTLTISYTENNITKTVDYTVDIEAEVDSIQVTAPTSTQKYNYGGSLDFTGATITVNYKNGVPSRTVTPTASMVVEKGTTNNVNMSPTSYDATNKVTKDVTLKYTEGGKTASADYQVEIINDVKSIAIHSTNHKTQYELNDTLDITNLEIQITRAVGSPEVKAVTNPNDVSGFNSSSGATAQPLTVSYTENGITKTTSYNVDIAATVDQITVTAPTSTQKYNHGASLDLTGATITVTYLDGSTPKTVTPTSAMVVEQGTTNNVNMTPSTADYGSTNKVTKNVRLKYTECGVTGYADYQVEIINDVKSIAVHSTNHKVKYNVADSLDITNLEIQITRALGAPEVKAVTNTNDVSGFNSSLPETGQTLTISYTENGITKTVDYTVDIEAEVDSIQVTAPTAIQKYNHGGSLDLTGATITVNYKNGVPSRTVTPTASMVVEKGTTNNVNMSPTSYDATNKVTKDVTLKYTEGGKTASADYQVEIINDVKSIAIHSTNHKTQYDLNDPLDITNLEIQITRAVGSPEVKAITNPNDVTGFDSSSPDVGQVLTVSYTENRITETATYTVDIIATVDKITVTAPTATQKYNHGASLNLTGATITVDYLNGVPSRQVTPTASMVVEQGTTNNVNMSPATYDSTNKVTKNVTLKYTEGGKAGSANYQVEIINDIKSIAVHSTNHKVSYKVGDTLDISNLQVLVTRAVGTAETKDITNINDVSGFDSSLPVTGQTLTISYTENGITKTVDYTVDIEAEVDTIQVTAPTSTQKYNHGGNLDLTGATITVNYKNGVPSKTVTPTAAMVVEQGTTNNVNMSPASYDSTNKVTKNVTLTYTEGGKTGSANYQVEIINDIKSIAITTNPKKAYRVGDTLDVSTGVITITRAVGTSTTNMTNSMVSGFDSSAENTNLPLSVSYTENGITKQTSYNVSVVDNVSDVQLEVTPKTSYKYGESLDVSAGKLKITKDSGTSIINMNPNMVTEVDGTPFKPNKLGSRNLKISYGGKTLTYPITISDYVVDTVLTAPSKNKYNYGESLDLTGGKIKTIMASGATTPDIPLTDNSVTLSEFKPTKQGAQTIKVTYDGKQIGTFGVIVEDNVQSIKMKTTPKTTYKYGESLNVQGGKIEATKASSAKEDITITPSMVTGFNPNKIGPQTLTVTYNNKTTTYDVTVEDVVKDINITKPTKLVYKIGEQIDLSNGLVNVIMASGNKVSPIPMTSADVTIQGFNTSKVGANIIKVTYKGITKTFGITVVDPLSDVVLKTPPNKTDYKYGEDLDVTGATLEIKKASGTKETIKVTKDMLSGYNPKKLGDQTVTVTYQGFKNQFVVNVKDYISKLQVEEPDKVEYEYGQSLDLTGGKVSIIMASGKTGETEQITASMVSGFSPNKEGSQTIKVEYKGLQGQFKVNVVDKIKGISINTQPDKIEYEKGEDLNLKGATITVIKSSGITQIPVTKDMVKGYDSTTPGTQVITVTYGGFETKFIVLVKPSNNENSQNNNTEDEKEDNTEDSTQEETARPIKVVYISTTPSTSMDTTEEEEDQEEVEEFVEENNGMENIEEKIPESNQTNSQQNSGTNKEETLTAVLGVKDEKQDQHPNKITSKQIAGGVAIAAALMLILLILFRRNVKVYVQEDGEYVLGGLDKITKNEPKIDVDKYLDKETYPNKVKIVLNDSISEKLDGKEVELTHRGQKIKVKVKYEDEPYEITLD